MVADVAVETRKRAKRNKAMVVDEEKTPPPPPPAVRMRRLPTPDHPPYCWMIGEAIDKLGDDGGSSEDSISSFIRAAHPGVPVAHDRFLRHYLAKHVAEGFFVCTAPGRYARRTDGAAAVEAPMELALAGPSEAARVEPSVVRVKRGRGRPRKDGSTSPAIKKDVTEGPVTPKRRGRPPGAARRTAAHGSVPSSSVAAAGAADKNGSQAAVSVPRRRRGRQCKLTTNTVVSMETVVTDKEEDSTDAPSTTGNEHRRSIVMALMCAKDVSARTPAVDDKVCGKAPPSMPVDSDQPRELALVTTTDMPAPVAPVDEDGGAGEAESFNLALVVKRDDISATSTTPEPSGQACELALAPSGDGPVPVLVSDKIDVHETPSAMYKRLLRPRPQVSPMVIAAQGSAPSAAGEKARGKTLSATPKAKGRRQGKLAMVATGTHSAPTSVIGKKAGVNAGSIATLKLKPTPVTAGAGNGVPSGARGQSSRLYPLTADEIPDDPSLCLLALPAVASA